MPLNSFNHCTVILITYSEIVLQKPGWLTHIYNNTSTNGRYHAVAYKKEALYLEIYAFYHLIRV